MRPATAVALLATLLPAQPELSWATFETLRDRILPTADELAFRAIPWRATFAQAALEADAAGKPVLLWAMNGHPLGCT